MTKEAPNQDKLFEIDPDKKVDIENLDVTSNSGNPHVLPENFGAVKPHEDSAAGMSAEGLKKVITTGVAEAEENFDRTSELPGFTPAIASGQVYGTRPKKAPAAGKPERRPRRWEKPANQRTASEKRHADEAPPHIRAERGRE